MRTKSSRERIPKHYVMLSSMQLALVALMVITTILTVLLSHISRIGGYYNTFSLPLNEKMEYSVEVLDRNAERLHLYTTKNGYWRLPVQITDVDPRFLKFLLRYEDRRFYQHPGTDFFALLRALGQAISFGHFVSGGSTLTMQTVRLLHPRARTLINKLVEIVDALWLEHRYSKQQILTLYLTLAPYGGNIQGLRAASLLYFGKEPAFLTIAESALLVAIPQAPETRRPDRHIGCAMTARTAVLQRLVTAGVLSQADATQAATAPLPQKRHHLPELAIHFTNRVRAANPGEFSINASLDAKLQYRIEALLSRQQERLPPGITIAALIVENRTLAVRAYVGSGNYFATNFSGQLDMVRAIRSPGSTLKPFVYGLAFDAGIAHPDTLIFDRPGAVNGYAPGNFDHRYRGEIEIREALWTSRNIPAIKVLDKLGVNTLLQRFATVGVTLHFPARVTSPGLPIVLGGVGLRLEDLVRLYACLANSGIFKNLQFSAKIVDYNKPVSTTTELLSPAAAWYLTDILAESQPPSGFTIRSQHLAFKTGTSYGFRDAWAIGYNVDYTVGIWLGRPDNGYTADLSGLESAVPILLESFEQLPDTGLTPLLRNPPPGVLIAQNNELPAGLRHFDFTATPAYALDAEPLKIIYPPPYALVELTNNPSAKVHLEISGGQPPFHILVNGRPLMHEDDRRNLDWLPEVDGQIQLSVLDVKGHSAQVHLQIKWLPLHQ